MVTQGLSALGELVFAVALAIVSYPSYLRTLEHYDAARGQVDLAGGFVLGATVYLGFFFTGRGVLAVALFGEGLVRLLGAAAGIEVGTLLGFALRHARAAVQPRQREAMPPDAVRLGSDVLTIESATARLLEPTNVVEHEGRDFLCERVEDGVPPRPYRYLLRPLRDGEVVRKRVVLPGRPDASARTSGP